MSGDVVTVEDGIPPWPENGFRDHGRAGHAQGTERRGRRRSRVQHEIWLGMEHGHKHEPNQPGDAKLLHKLRINGRKRLGFYTLRQPFRTLAKDQPAVGPGWPPGLTRGVRRALQGGLATWLAKCIEVHYYRLVEAAARGLVGC